jgi:hypothetical protein
MVGIKRVLPRKGLVIVVAPVAATTRNWVLFDEAVLVTRAEEACEPKSLQVGVPVVAPVV